GVRNHPDRRRAGFPRQLVRKALQRLSNRARRDGEGGGHLAKSSQRSGALLRSHSPPQRVIMTSKDTHDHSEGAPLAQSKLDDLTASTNKLKLALGQVIVGHDDVIDGVITCILAGSHALLEGVPGLGKTLLVRTLSETIDLPFSRIQFTPDLMPADILGTTVVLDAKAGGERFEFRKGPIFSPIVLADEINRATPKTQSALL